MTTLDVDVELRCIAWSVEDGVATVVLNRPERGNSWTGRMEMEYRAVIDAAERSDRVGAIVITGAGKHFCVGADTQAVAAISDHGGYASGLHAPLVEPGDPAHPAHGARHGFLLSLTKPVIAAVNGAAAGIGLVVACFCDVRIVAETGKLTTSTSRLGLPAEFGISWILPRLIGVSRALPLLLGSAVISGRDAVVAGLAHAAVPADEVLATAQAYAQTLIRDAAPSSLATVKAQLWQDLNRGLVEADRDADTRMKAMVSSPDFTVGARALSTRVPADFGARYRIDPTTLGHHDA